MLLCLNLFKNIKIYQFNFLFQQHIISLKTIEYIFYYYIDLGHLNTITKYTHNCPSSVDLSECSFISYENMKTLILECTRRLQTLLRFTRSGGKRVGQTKLFHQRV